MAYIDCIATDHAPHLLREKDSDSPPPGFPLLEVSFALMLTAVHAGRLSLEDVLERMAHAPRRLFGIPEPEQTWIEVDTDLTWQPRGAEMFSRAAWTPFEGWTLRGRVESVTLRARGLSGRNQLRRGGDGAQPRLKLSRLSYCQTSARRL